MASQRQRRQKALALVQRFQGRPQPKRYRQLIFSGRHMLLHRAVMTLLLGRELRRDEHVHHIDGNLPNNLLLMSAGAHLAHTHRRHPLVHYCERCGEPFVSDHPRQRYCSLTCSARHRQERRRQQPERPARTHVWQP